MENVCIPIHLDAFALSEKCCDKALHSKIAPYVQPNYTALRLDSHTIQHDVLDHIDFHSSSPASSNPRVADLGAPVDNNIKRNRLGIHLHWSLPKFYRASKSSARKSDQSADPNKDSKQPVFRQVPNRWLVVRHLKNFNEAKVLKEYQAWVIESDAVQYIKEIPDDVDLESEVSPFVSYKGDPSKGDILNSQTEVFLGQKFDLGGWKEARGKDHLQNGLTVMSSSNPLFPDYALHNTNVFSIIDSFRYKTNLSDSEYKYLDNARCDYFVIGWHSDGDDDPMTDQAPGDAAKYDLNARLSDLGLQLNADRSKAQGKSAGTTRCLVFGSIFDVNYSKTMPRSLAEEAATKFLPESVGGFKMEPLSVGTTPLDGILTFLAAHQHEVDGFFGTDTNTIADYILDLSQLLFASADQYDSRIQAQDLIAQQNFAKADGGLQWTFNDKSGGQKPKSPSTDTANSLRVLNEQQIRLDSIDRKLKARRWDLFAEWWKFSSEYLPPVNPARQNRIDQCKGRVDVIKQNINGDGKKGGLLGQKTTLQGNMQPNSIACKNSAMGAYFQRMDPTLCIAGLDSGWPLNLNDNLTVLMDSDLVSDTEFANSVFGSPSINPIPNSHGLQATAAKLISTCQANAATKNGATATPNIQGFQAWGGRNPFIPIFVEWESLYYHINKDNWEIALRPSPFGHPTPQIRYYIPENKLDASSQKDVRSLSGRVLILPQPVFNLENIIKNVIDTPDAAKLLKAEEKQKLLDNIRQIKFVSAPLSGLTSHLLTRCEGAHVKPTVRTQGEVLRGITAAAKTNISLPVEDLTLIDSESALTPYGNLMEFNPLDYPNEPFKGVTHGQMVFTKINIVDKFGQAICLPVPTKRRVHPVQPPQSKIYPCLSHYLAPDAFGGKLNTVFPTDPIKDSSWPLCPYIQLSPAINQNARINASFLVQDTPPITTSTKTFSPWREATDYESPIFGWLINNYADNGLQFFRGDGQFYCEIRKGGVAGTTRSAALYLPFDPPKLEPTDAGTAQLAKLLDQLSPANDPNGTYLQGFFDMVNGSILDTPFPPGSYSAYANSIIGKPLALVNVGWSIELAEEPLKQQYSLRPPVSDPLKVMSSYQFPLKVGDHTRTFDGVVGYFKASNPSSNATDQLTDFKTTYTYYNSGASPNMKDASPNDLKLTPYYSHPDDGITPNMLIDRERHYTVTSLLMDPYVSIHGYSPILPTKQLTLSPWSVEEAMKNMHAFFRLGPSLLREDVPKTLAAATTNKQDGLSVKLPVSGAKGTWSWLQPYAIGTIPATPGAVTTKEGDDTKFAEIPVSQDPGEMRFDNGPYTFIEGYLQLTGTLSSAPK